MKKIIPSILLMATWGFALPTLEGTRGTNFVSSAFCEDMGYLWFYMASGGYMATVTSVNLSGSTRESNLFALQPAVLSIGFTPWHYLEFSVYGSGYFFHNSDPSINAYGLSYVGGHVKGSFPLNPLDKPVRLATGIDGFIRSTLPYQINPEGDQAIGEYLLLGNPYFHIGPQFGGKGLFSLESQYFSGHLNTSYLYGDRYTIGNTSFQVHTIIAGLGLESTPIKWLNFFTDLNLSYLIVTGDLDVPSQLGSFYTTVGVRIPFKFGPRWIFHLGGGADPRDFQLTSTLFAGLALGGDLIVSKEKFIEGIVMDEKTGEPVVNAMLEFTGDFIDTTFYSDSLGKFTLSEFLEWEQIQASKAGYHPETMFSDEFGERIVITMTPIGESYIAGIVSDAETDDPLGASVRFVDVVTGETTALLACNSSTGYFRTSLSPGRYWMSTLCLDHKPYRKVVTIEPENHQLLDIFLEPIAPEEPEPLPELPPITIAGFGRKEHGLSFFQMPELEKVAELLEENPDATVVITGHTDSVGSGESNYWVGMERARRVAEFLAMRGIDTRRVKVESGGEHYPVADNRYRSGRAANRRVELYFNRDAERSASQGVTSKESNL